MYSSCVLQASPTFRRYEKVICSFGSSQEFKCGASENTICFQISIHPTRLQRHFLEPIASKPQATICRTSGPLGNTRICRVRQRTKLIRNRFIPLFYLTILNSCYGWDITLKTLAGELIIRFSELSRFCKS